MSAPQGFDPGARVWSGYTGHHGVVIDGEACTADRLLVQFDGEDDILHVKREVLHPVDPKPAAGYTLDATGRPVADGWDHDGDLAATFQADLNRQAELGDALATAAATLLAHTDTDAPADLTGELGRAVRAWEAAR